MIKKILIANRGEIACRVMRSAREMEIKTVAVFSDIDRNAPHVFMADEAIHIGASQSKDSYLAIDKIINACKQTNADAVHPGYGFLSENANFAKRLHNENIILIGPNAASMEIMGGKISAKQAVAAYNVPLIPGIETAITDIALAKRRAEEIGYPILIKANAGGGGKGMRLLEQPEDFESQMRLAISEAVSAFGDGSVFIEKYISKPRHIEIQIIADNYGNICYLYERECSIQRRHQKLVEEAPSSILTPSLRSKIGESACFVAKACNYSGAGTVEFLLDADMNYFFLEMNTRLQVEHTVSECITGIDIVKEQIRVANGEKLSFTQNEIPIHGHAIELRICAEDPLNNFLPDIGTLNTYIRPQGIGIRVDDGIEQGMTIPIYYDPLIAKLIVWANNRTEAIARMKRAIQEYKISGVATTIDFGTFVMNHPLFISGDFDTNFIKDHFAPLKLQPVLSNDESQAAISIVELLIERNNTCITFPQSKKELPFIENYTF